MVIINEESSGRLTCEFFDEDLSQATPTVLTYRIDCLTTGVAVRGSTALTPGVSAEITLEPDDTAIQDPSNDYELKEVTVSADAGTEDAINGVYRYKVLNLHGVE